MTASIDAHTLKSWLHDGQEIALLDVREHGQYGESHLFYATPLPYSRLELDVPRLVPRRQVRVVTYDGGEGDASAGVAERAARRLEALGYTRVAVLEGGAKAWSAAGYTLFAGVNLPSKTFGELAEHAYGTPRITAQQLAARQAAGLPLVVLDGRPVSEFHKMNIPGAICCPNGELALRVSRLVPDAATPIVVNCAGRTRSIIGAQTLINLGIPNPVYALENGTQGWYLADLPLEHGGTQRYGDDSASSALQAQARALAERFDVPEVDADTVRAWSQDAARTLFLCDVRTPEEFKAGSLPGAQHARWPAHAGRRPVRGRARCAPGAVRQRWRARPVVASWLRQLGHDACVLRGGLQSGLDLAPAQPSQVPALAGITAQALHERMHQGEVAVVDLRAGMKYRAGHIAGARWSIRPCLASDLAGETRQIVLVADEPGMAQWAALELQGAAPLLLEGGLAAWQQAGLPVEATPDSPTDAECIDYLFFVHDRHDGNKEAARRYLAWETGLVPQLDAQELAAFRLPSA